MKISQVAAQLFTLRDYIKTPADIAATLKRVRAIGYEAVQVSAMGPIPEAELVRILNGEGLICCATHEPADRIINEPNLVVERLKKLDCKYTAYPYPANVPLDTVENIVAFAKRLEASGRVLAANGCGLCYHNHSMEFQKRGGRTILEWIYDETDPEAVMGEPDTYWIQHGGCDPVAWCRSLAGRLPLLHVKDYAIGPDNNPVMAELGNGNLNWPAIIEAAEESGCEWFIVEQDICPGDPFESLAISFEYLAGHAV